MINHKKDIKPRDKNDKPNGYWIMYYDGTNKPWFKGNYLHGQKIGLWLWYNHSASYNHNITKEYHIN